MNVNAAVEMEDLYRAAVGPKRADYYAPKFLQFDVPGGSKISWNWSAFLVSFYWFLYRRMYGDWAIYCLLIPLVIAAVSGVVSGIYQSPRLLAVATVGSLAYSYLIIPMFANALYHRAVRVRIDEVRRKVPDPATQITVLENSPHTSAIAWVALLLLFIPLIGIMAAIAIPAYQNYVTRAQVADGLTLARPLEAAVVSHYSADRQWPAALSDIGMSQAPADRYVASVDLDHGTLTITYGNQAAPSLSGHTLSLRPTLASPNSIAWSCGNAPRQDSDSGTEGPNRTDIPDASLPLACRSSGRSVP